MSGPPTPTTGVLRVCRGVVLAVTSAALAVAAHAVGGGDVPATGLTVLLTVGVAAVGIAMADRRCSTASILAVLGSAQLATHVLLSVESMDMYSGSGAHVDGTLMLVAHAIAVLCSASLLARADAVLFLVAAVLGRVLPLLVAVPPVAGAPARPLPLVRPHDRLTAVLLCRSNARRGPPAYA